MKILIVHDDPGILNALRVGLASFGYHGVVAQNGRDALKVIKSSLEGAELVDLMITDLEIPDIDGMELIRSARKMIPRLPSILMTAIADERFRKEVRRLGSCGYVISPFTPEDLRKIINEIVA